MAEQEIYRGQTLIFPLDITIDKQIYTFMTKDKVKAAIISSDDCGCVIIQKEVNPTPGEKSVDIIFTEEETKVLKIGEKYILQADLINEKGTHPMTLDTLRVVGQAIDG